MIQTRRDDDEGGPREPREAVLIHQSLKPRAPAAAESDTGHRMQEGDVIAARQPRPSHADR